MNKKLVAFLLASSMVFQAGIASFAAELSNGDSEKTVTVNSESGERTVNKEVIVLGGEGSISKNTADNVERAIMGKDTIEENTKPVEDNTQIDTSNIKKSAVTKSDVALYTDEQLSQEAGKLPKNKIVDVLEDKDALAKVRYDKTEGWINKQNLKPYEATSFGKVVNNVPYISQLVIELKKIKKNI